jgi:two-component system phosphate regulon sensor histidine kinase PhoR
MGTAFLVLAGFLLLATNLAWWWRARREREAAARRCEECRSNEKRLREQIERDQAGREAVLNCMTEGLLVLGEDGRVRLVNLALGHLFGLASDVRGRTLLEALQRHELEELVVRARRAGQALGEELEVPGRNPRVLQVNATTFGDGPASERGVILVFHDVTRLGELERARRDFVANVSHELRTPLSMIKGYVETLIDGARSDPEVSLRFLQTIEKHANRLTFLIEDLLTISQLESGRLALNRQRGELRPLAVRVLEDLGSRAAAREVILANAVPEGIELRADFDRLQQVLFNLVDNAIKYGRTGGRVTLGAGLENPGAPEARVEIWVTDDGPGIPRESLDRVFERFYRVDTARSREQGGTGLGLSIVKHIVQAHGGEVRAESEVGRGATFRVALPVEPGLSPGRGVATGGGTNA